MRNHANYVFHYLSLFPLDGSPHFNYSSHHILSAFSLSTPPEPAARPQGRMINTALARLTPHQLNNKHPEHVRVTTKCGTFLHYYVDDETRILYFVTFCHRRRQHQVINCLWPFLFVLGGNGGDYQELTHKLTM